jgi:cyclopropane fatty-acyl-phospholipid synthase-like methyltransferase
MKTETPSWQYDEFKHAGVDYASVEVAREYDAHHTKFRDYEKDVRLIMDRLELKPEQTLLDLGCGTGAMVIPIAKHCRKVYAVDVSPAMLGVCIEKAQAQNLTNIEPQHAGFLTFQAPAEPVDALITVAALHHLPDFWKAVALKRIHDCLKPGGKFYLFDVVFSFPPEDYAKELSAWVNGMKAAGGEEVAKEVATHASDEFSTYEWIMDGMLEKAGLSITRKYTDFPRCIGYLCTRK